MIREHTFFYQCYIPEANGYAVVTILRKCMLMYLGVNSHDVCNLPSNESGNLCVCARTCAHVCVEIRSE